MELDTTFNFRINQETKDKFCEIAKKEGHDPSNFARFLIERFTCADRKNQIVILEILKNYDSKALELFCSHFLLPDPLDKIFLQKIKEFLRREQID